MGRRWLDIVIGGWRGRWFSREPAVDGGSQGESMDGRTADAIVAAFIERFLADRECGAPQPLEAYQARYPGFADAIAHEFGVLTGVADAGPGTAATGPRLGLRYEDRGLLGKGGMGEVRRVFDRDIRREVARKTLRSDRAEFADNPRNLMRFLEEAQIAGQLEHPGIIPVHDLGVHEDGRAFFTMSLVRGREFGEVIDGVHHQRDGWTTTRALDVLLRVCDAVAFAHSKGVAHRDLKPSNIMVGEFGRTHVVDWGLARVLQRPTEGVVVTSMRQALRDRDAPADLTLRGDLLGTPSYMSPEQAVGDIDRVGFASDAYALGAILYQLLTGRAPFCDETTSTSAEVLAKLRQGPPPPVHSIRRDAPAELVAVCEKAMARSPEDRYASVSAFADDLRAFLDVRVVQAYQSGPFAELRKWVRRNGSLAWTGVAAAMALIAGLAVSLYQKSVADAQAQRADSNFTLASDAVDRMLTQVGTHLADVPLAQEARREVLREALAFQRELLDRRRDDPAARLEVVRALDRVASIHEDLSEYEEAFRHADEAVQRLAAFTPSEQNSAAVIEARGRAYQRRGIAETELARFDDGRMSIEQALEDFRTLIRRFPERASLRRDELGMLNSFANTFTRRKLWQQAIEPRERLVELARAYVRDQPEDAEGRGLLGTATQNLALTLAQTGAFEPAKEHIEAALALDADNLGGTRKARQLTANSWHIASMIRYRCGDPGGALVALERGIEAWQALADAYPSIPHYRSELGNCYNNIANVDPDRAIEVLQRAIRFHTLAFQMSPNTPRYPVLLVQSRRTLCRFLQAAEDVDELARRAEEIGAQAPESPADAAQFLASCASLAAADATLSTAEQDRRREEYVVRSLHYLERAARESGAAVFDDASFDALRNRDDFRELRARY